jgi:hypothetical protein
MEKRKTMIERQALIATALSAAAVTPKVEICGGCHLPWIGERDGSMDCATDGRQVFEWWREDQASDHLAVGAISSGAMKPRARVIAKQQDAPSMSMRCSSTGRGFRFGAA